MDGFNEGILVEKLAKLNNSQTSIETLSHWCCFHRAKRSKQVVQTWSKEFAQAPTDRKVTLLYLANDILQNSRKKGPEFVNEFWTALPPLLMDRNNAGDAKLQQAVGRLTKIWDERKVFGSKSAVLVQALSPRGPASPSLSKSSSLKGIAGPAYTALITNLKALHETGEEEKGALEESRNAGRLVGDLQKLIEAATSSGGEPASSLLSDLQKQHATLVRTADRLKAFESRRTNAITLLSEALRRQETERTALRDAIKASSETAAQAERLQSRFAGPPAEPTGREEYTPGTFEPPLYSPTHPVAHEDLPPGYHTPTTPASYAPAPEYLKADIDPSVETAGPPEMTAADVAASLASSENPVDLLQAFHALTQEGFASLGGFRMFQDDAKRQKTEHSQGDAFGGGAYQEADASWQQPQEGVQNYQASEQYYPH